MNNRPRNWPYGPFVDRRENGVIEVAMRNGDRFFGKGWLPAVVVRAYVRRWKRWYREPRWRHQL